MKLCSLFASRFVRCLIASVAVMLSCSVFAQVSVDFSLSDPPGWPDTGMAIGTYWHSDVGGDPWKLERGIVTYPA